MEKGADLALAAAGVAMPVAGGRSGGRRAIGWPAGDRVAGGRARYRGALSSGRQPMAALILGRSVEGKDPEIVDPPARALEEEDYIIGDISVPPDELGSARTESIELVAADGEVLAQALCEGRALALNAGAAALRQEREDVGEVGAGESGGEEFCGLERARRKGGEERRTLDPPRLAVVAPSEDNRGAAAPR